MVNLLNHDLLNYVDDSTHTILTLVQTSFVNVKLSLSQNLKLSSTASSKSDKIRKIGFFGVRQRRILASDISYKSLGGAQI